MAYPPPANESPFYEYSDPRMQYPAGQTLVEAQTSRPQADSSIPNHTNSMQNPSQYRQPQQPIRDAISSAVHHADNPNHISPEVITQLTESITESVKESILKQLKTSGLDPGTPTPPTQQHFPPPQPPPQPAPQSPSPHSGYSPNMPNRVYTPPSPNKHSEFSNYDSPHSQTAVPHSPPYNARRPSSPNSVESEPIATRPRGPERLSTGKEETTLEKVWGQLFDEGGNPTARLGQLLRGLAIHIVRSIFIHSTISKATLYLPLRFRLKIMNLAIASSSLHQRC